MRLAHESEPSSAISDLQMHFDYIVFRPRWCWDLDRVSIASFEPLRATFAPLSAMSHTHRVSEVFQQVQMPVDQSRVRYVTQFMQEDVLATSNSYACRR